MRIRTLLLLGIACATRLSGQVTTSDCNGAIHLCGGVYTETSAPLGTGNVYEFTGTCNADLETASLWYTFTVTQEGNLSFILDPANDADDYDWGLFDITTGGCAGINAQDGSSPEVNCNSYGSLSVPNAQTGISSANGGTGTSNGPGDLNGPPFNADLPVQVGRTYALVVMNWTGSQEGYTIDFTQSTASIYDDVPPQVVGVLADCGDRNFVVAFSEPIVTSTVAPTDFTLTSPSGTVYPFTTVVPGDPTASAQTTFTLGLGGVISEGGVYTFTVTSITGNVEDRCGNTVVDTTYTVPLPEPLHYTVAVSTACNGTGGSVQATYVSGGTLPVDFLLDNTTMPNGVATGLAAGGHALQLVDAAGCAYDSVVTIPDHVLHVSVPQDQDSLSCTSTSITIEGVTVAPEQAVNYSWTAETATGTMPGFSSSAAPAVTQPGLYTVQVTDPQSGCQDEATVVISPSARPTVDLNALVLPNVVSPNADGKNDVWRPYSPDDPYLDVTPLFDTYALKVFNRWGGSVYDTSDGGSRTWKAKDAPEGTYFYTLAYRSDCGTVVDKKVSGSITVLR